MNKNFAKIFETEAYGQVLVMLDTNDDGNPAVKFYCNPPQLGVCSIGPTFKDTDAGWDQAEALFEKADLKMATDSAFQLFQAAQEMTAAGDAA